MVTIKDNIFKAYDIRGLYPEEVNEQSAQAVARALVKYTNARNIVVGIDGRKSSPSLYDAVEDALLHMGVDVIDIGMATTPLFYYAINHFKADGGIMITASHNGDEYNGMKLTQRGAVAVLPKDIKHLIGRDIKIYKKGRLITKRDISDSYIDFLLRNVKIARAKKFLNVIAKDKSLEIAQRILHKLKAKVKDDAEMTFEFDPDGDRLMVKDMRADYLFGILAEDTLDQFNPSKPTFIYDARFTKSVPEFIKSNGGDAIKSRVGRVFIQDLMRQYGAKIGGEVSGHFYFKETNYFDDAMFAMLKFIKISNEKGSLRNLVDPFDKYFSSGEINIRFANNFNELAENLEKQYSDGKIDRIDGVTVEYPTWWFNVRPSNTEPLIRIIIEAQSKALLEEKIEELKRAVS